MAHDLLRLHLAMATDMIHLDAIPAPLRIPPKQSNDIPHSRLHIVRCNALAKPPSPPIFGDSKASEHDAIQSSKSCQCLKSPMSPLFSPFSLQDGSVNRVPSRDFSALFMKSPILRQELEQCTCQHPATPRSNSVSSSLGSDQSDTSSVLSGYTSVDSQ